LPNYEKLLGDGSELGLKLFYKKQPSPDGLAQAFIIGEEFIGSGNVCLVLGDNIFYGSGFSGMLKNAKNNVLKGKSTVFGYYVNDPERYGVAEFDNNENVISIEEKPKNPKSNYAVVGLYFYTNEVIQIAKNIKPSERGELEISSINQVYLDQKKLKVELLGRGFTWLDTGTHNSLLEAGNFIESIESRKGLKVACIEEIAYRMNYIDADQVRKLAKPLGKNAYGQYLLKLVKK
jgi:glucose-1-phosphate thymidylyltransferase